MLSNQEILLDLFLDQSFLVKEYCNASLECSHIPVRNEMLNLLNEEHRLHTVLLEEVKKRGLFAEKTADKQRQSQTEKRYNELI